MKRVLLKATVTSILVNITGFLFNFGTYQLLDKMFLGIPISGGEMRGCLGFGLYYEQIFPVTETGMRASSKTELTFLPQWFAISFVGFFVLFIIIFGIFSKRKLKRQQSITN